MRKYPKRQDKIKKAIRKISIFRKWSLAGRVEHTRIKGKQRRK